MRGTVEADFSQAELRRITPAHAGNSNIKSKDLDPNQDHPRPCGEQLII